MGRPAGFWVRLGAAILDGLIIGVPLSIISYLITGNAEDNIFTSTMNLIYTVLVPVIWSGYTVGKKIVGVRIAKVNGEKLGFGTMLMRTVVAGLVYLLTLGIGVIVSAFMVGLRQDKRAIHDFIAGTYVTYEKPDEINYEQ
ncbi:RDD family protein [Mesobacillus sp. AQ2]|uniref:RDD family protein n=1 Tax=unclassified Mesobacillus TaxID=2675270 RepID=UPI00203DAE47|nr:MULTISPECIES: RDD family protein [unclassified Mesobacillus]MCM3121782.1 RDD family protein [Mesobacillus sp. MER 33]MCM3231746.1 RDD family protein [Mesobacillus sp. MER 48]WHX38714.1 RDD family protein [Mesobacillus sp. AQ2]